VLTTRHRADLPAEEVVDGVRVIRLRPVARMSRGFVVPSFPLAARRLIRQADVVQIHTPLMESLLVAGLARASRRPLVMTHQGDLVMPAGLVNQSIERLGTAMLRATESLATAITTHNRDYAEHSSFLRPFLGKLTAIYPPADIPDPAPDEALAWRRELRLADKRLVGFAGRWVEEKGFDYLLRALPALADREPDVHLVYAGESDMVYERFYERCLPLLEAQRGRVTLLGLLGDRRRLANFYAMCDVLAVPSRTDCFAITQVEAMLCGTPVVVSDIPGARVPVRETGMGVTVEPRNPLALADGIAEVLARRDSYAGRRDRARSLFDRDRSIAAYAALLADVAGGRDGAV
jgi:glycosyltransferase involved in cell wall biosynthesis